MTVSAAEQFLRLVLPPRRDDEVYRTEVFPRPAFPANNWVSLTKLAAHVEAVGQTANAYVAMGTFPTGSNDRLAAHVLRLGGIWADMDCGPGKPYATKDEARAALRQFSKNLRPIAVLDSGRGLHPHWGLVQPVEGADIDRAVRIMRGLAQVLQSDPAVADRARIMRVPGTMNLDPEHKKDGLSYPVSAVYLGDETAPRYTLDDFAAAGVPEIDRGASNREASGIAADGARIPAGSRNATLTSKAGGMRRRGSSEAAILAALLIENEEQCDPPLDRAEVEAIAMSVARYVPDPMASAPRMTTTAAASDRGPAPASSRMVKLIPVATIRPRPVRWLWRDRLPAGEVASTPGRGGVGKSTFHAWLTAGITRGTVDGVYYGQPRPVIIAASEDSWSRTIVPRLIAAGADLDLVYRAEVVTEVGELLALTLPADCESLGMEIERLGAVMLSVDPLMSVIEGGLDTHKDRDVRQALEPLAQLADRTGCLVLGNAHFNKSSGSDPLAMIMGSAAFGNVVRAALGFARDPESADGACVISQVKNNLGRLDLPSLGYVIEPATIQTDEGPAEVGRLRMTGESERSVADILGDHAGPDDGATRTEAKDWLFEYLTDAGGSALAKEVLAAARNAKFKEQAITHARIKIRAKSTRHGFGPQAYYTWSLRGYDDGLDEEGELQQDDVDPSMDSMGAMDGESPPMNSMESMDHRDEIVARI